MQYSHISIVCFIIYSILLSCWDVVKVYLDIELLLSYQMLLKDLIMPMVSLKSVLTFFCFFLKHDTRMRIFSVKFVF